MSRRRLPVDDCPFCQRIKAGEYTGQSYGVVTFEPLHPVTAGHLLVVPRQHVRHAATAPSVTAEVMRQAAGIAGKLDTAANIITSIGADATQTVFHLHVHVIPRRRGDGLHLPWTGQSAEAEAVAAERQRIKLAVLGCRDCGEIHEPRNAPLTFGNPTGVTWRDPGDGHAYAARYVVLGGSNGLPAAWDRLTEPPP
jgi:histidine triad (HIT) family protein